MMPCSGIRLLPRRLFPESADRSSGAIAGKHPCPARKRGCSGQPCEASRAGIAKTAIEGNRRRMKRPCERVSFPFLFQIFWINRSPVRAIRKSEPLESVGAVSIS
jgi:hypothetical protein